jgi:hypothetical protein
MPGVKNIYTVHDLIPMRLPFTTLDHNQRFVRMVEWIAKTADHQDVDMNAIPDTLRDYDFCWSACSLEHTGSIDNGLCFIENSLDTLKPGGVAVHTTEFNLSSDTDTIEEGGTVLFRKQDIMLLARLLRTRKHKLLPLNFYAGSTEVDKFVDVPPYQNDPHLRLRIERYRLTSIGLAIIKR